MSKESDAQPAAAPAGKPPGVLKWVAIGVVLALVAGGTAGGILWFLLRPASAAAEDATTDGAEGEEPKAEAPPEPKAVIALEPFLVNLADQNANRFVRVTLQLAVESEHQAEEIGKNAVHQARLRSAIIETLALQTSTTLVTPEGKAALKTTVAERCSKALGDVKVLDVLFTDFVVQF